MNKAGQEKTEASTKILIIEDDPLIIDFLKMGLVPEGFEIATASEGKAAIESFRQHQPGLVILDLRLPGLSGDEVCTRIRAESNVPILVLTALDRIEDKVKLFKSGADDYLIKPFNFDELLLRIQALLRRAGAAWKQNDLKFLDIEMKVNSREVLRAGIPIDLSAKEFDMLHLFLRNPHLVLSKDSILNKIWGYDYDSDSNIVEVYIGHLRRKLGEPSVIQTMHGIGYTLRLKT
ncbi:MAG: response regulator transcription factor [Dehalococcoidales bacterium]|nr:response regulator transcription factor [Dehalococcoidales bacterium]